MEEPRITPYERQRYANLGFKVELVDGVVVKRPMTEKEVEIEGKWADEVLQGFTPRRMPLEASRKPAGAFK